MSSGEQEGPGIVSEVGSRGDYSPFLLPSTVQERDRVMGGVFRRQWGFRVGGEGSIWVEVDDAGEGRCSAWNGASGAHSKRSGWGAKLRGYGVPAEAPLNTRCDDEQEPPSGLVTNGSNDVRCDVFDGKFPKKEKMHASSLFGWIVFMFPQVPFHSLPWARLLVRHYGSYSDEVGSSQSSK